MALRIKNTHVFEAPIPALAKVELKPKATSSRNNSFICHTFTYQITRHLTLNLFNKFTA